VAGASVGIWIALKAPDGTWSAFHPHTLRLADASGTVNYVYARAPGLRFGEPRVVALFRALATSGWQP